MNKLLLFVLISMVSAVLLTGCKISGGDSSSGTGGSGSYSGSSSSVGGGSNSGGDSVAPSSENSPLGGAHNPEPATIALVAGGLAGYAMLRKKKKN